MKYLIPAVLALVGALALVGCARKPLTPAAPWTDVVNDTMYFLATTTDPGGLNIEYLFDWGDGQLARTTRRYESGETAYIKHSFVDPAWCEVRVQASNEKGKSSEWSAPLRFRRSHPPIISDDTISGLVRWAINRWYRASVRVTDPDGDSVSVRFEWDGDKGRAWTAFVPSGSVITDSCLWTAGGPHAVGLIAKDKGSVVTRAPVKSVSVGQMAVVWDTYDEELLYDGTPTLGLIDGEPVLYCVFDAVDCYTLDGRLRWSAPASGNGYAPSLSADGSRLYLTDYDNGLVCFDSRTGQRMWFLASCAGWCTPALGPDGALYVASAPDCVYELQRIRDCGDSAVTEWSLPLGDWGPIDIGVVVGRNGTVYANGFDFEANCSFLVAAAPNGTVLWKDSARIEMSGVPVIDSRDRILVADQSGCLYCFNPDGTLAWSTTTNELSVNSIAVGNDDEIIVTYGCGWLGTYDSSGRQGWTSPINLPGGNTPCVAQDSTVFAFDPEGYVYCIGSSGQTLWEFSVWDSLGVGNRRPKRLEGQGCTSAVIGPNGDLYLATYYGLVCVSHGGLKMAHTAWPTYNHDNAHSGWAGRQQR
jgi:hypothetical protein